MSRPPAFSGLQCRRSAIIKQATNVFCPSVLPDGNFQQTTSDFVAAWWRRHRRLCQFRYFGSPMYLLGAKCDPIDTKIGVKCTYWRLRRPNKYTIRFPAADVGGPSAGRRGCVGWCLKGPPKGAKIQEPRKRSSERSQKKGTRNLVPFGCYSI